MAKATMNTEELAREAQATRRERAEALIASRVQQLFDGLPLLIGFSLDPHVSAVDVELHRFPGHAWSPELYEEVRAIIIDVVIELAAQDPQSERLIGGRTFARHLH
ncbi:MAG: hypothetical protein ABR570_03555 [Burkholderiales bacterium]